VPDFDALAHRMFGAFGAGDVATMRDCMTEDMVGWITNARGGSDKVEGRENYLSRIPSVDDAEGRADVVQVLPIDGETMLVMAEIHAARKGRTLHNFGGFLARVRDGRIAELWMVDAKPAESDAFWA
jgi:ketosteroid isomerase-like protein